MLRPVIRKKLNQKNQGIALVTVLILIVMITTLVTVSTLLALGNKGSSTDTVLATQSQNLAEAGIEKSLDTVFYETYRRWVISTEGSANVKFDVCAFKKWLTGNWNASNYTTTQRKTATNENNNASCIYNNGNGLLPNNSVTNESAGVLPGLLNNTTITLPTFTIDGIGNTVSVTVKRVDVGDDITLTIESSSSIKNGTTELAGRKIARTLQLSGTPFPGDEYALLTNDINCAFCHLQVDNMTRAYADPTAPENLNKTFKRVKLGALNASPGINFDFTAQAVNDTFIAGTLYSRGTTAPTPGLNVHFAPWASAAKPGLIIPAPNTTLSAAITSTKYTAAVAAASYDPAAAGNFQQSLAINAAAAGAKPMGKLYYNYPFGPTAVDGILPDKFPSIIYDGNNDKLLSDAEWVNYMSGAPSGTLTPSGPTAVIYGVSRPSSGVLGAGIRMSYDPVNANPTFNGSRVGDTFAAGNFWANGVIGKAVGQPMTQAMLIADIGVLNEIIRDSNINVAPGPLPARVVPIPPVMPLGTPYAGTNPNLAQVQAAETAFRNQWAGWLVQQALASPNNRDLRPTNNTANAVVEPLNTNTFFPLSVPTGTAATVNNFWVAYSPLNNTFNLAYCRIDPCFITAAGTAATPEVSGGNSIRNVSILNAAALNANHIAVLSIPFAATDIFPSASNAAAGAVLNGAGATKSGYFDGNLIVDAGRIGDNGTSQRFVSITGTVHVNGDLVIRGQIKGEGRFIVRGNIYIVGDLVYGCEGSACLIKNADASKPSYTNPTALPKVAFMAGGSIIVGDYDHPDGRANRSQFNLINDQIGQNRGNGNFNPPITVSAANTAAWSSQLVPGSTGNNAVGGDQSGVRVMGFVHELAEIANNHTNVRFASSPFGFMAKRTGTGLAALGNYEDTATLGVQLNSLDSYTLQTLYPSNGPIRIGSTLAANNGFTTLPTAGGAIRNPNLRCANGVTNPLPLLPTVFNTTTLMLNSGFWCTPVGSAPSVRTWNGAGTPDVTAAAWMAQPGANQALDGGAGMTTGWLGGLLQTNQAGTGYDQIGDISQTRILKIMWLATMETAADRDPNTAGDQNQGPLRTDGMLYSPNAVFCVARYRQDNSSATSSNNQARWIHHGSLLSFELGFLLTGDSRTLSDPFATNRTTIMNHTPATTTTAGTGSGAINYAPSMGVFYDERLAGLLGFAGGAMEIRRTGVYAPVGR